MCITDGQLRDIWGCMLGIGAVAILEADRRAGTSNGRSGACDHIGLTYTIIQ